MELLYKALIHICIIIAVLIALLFLIINASGAGLLESGNKFAPGGLDKTKSNIMKVLIGLFMACLLGIGLVNNISAKSKQASVLNIDDQDDIADND